MERMTVKEKSEYDLLEYIQECGGAIVFSDENTNKATTLEDLEYNKRYIRFLLSRDAGFIKWLVEKDKIDGLKFYEENEFTPIGVNAKSDIDQVYSVEEQILMALSISSSPIDDLISYLK